MKLTVELGTTPLIFGVLHDSVTIEHVANVATYQYITADVTNVHHASDQPTDHATHHDASDHVIQAVHDAAIETPIDTSVNIIHRNIKDQQHLLMLIRHLLGNIFNNVRHIGNNHRIIFLRVNTVNGISNQIGHLLRYRTRTIVNRRTIKVIRRKLHLLSHIVRLTLRAVLHNRRFKDISNFNHVYGLFNLIIRTPYLKYRNFHKFLRLTSTLQHITQRNFHFLHIECNHVRLDSNTNINSLVNDSLHTNFSSFRDIKGHIVNALRLTYKVLTLHNYTNGN